MVRTTSRLTMFLATMAMVASVLALVAPAPAAHADTIKAPLSGLVDRNGKPVSGWESVVNNYVVRVTWAELQTTSGGAITANNKIDQAITAVRTWNATHTPPEALKIRIDAGTGAPDWAKNLDGPGMAVAVHDASDQPTPDNTPDTVGRFWEDNFGAAYNDFESKLATLYNGTPEIRDVTISRCTLSTVEPFLRTASSQNTVNNLLAAGYSVTADQACQQAQIDEAKAVWTLTPSSLALNPYQKIVDATHTPTDEAYTESMITYCRNTLGSLCVLENNSLRDPLQTGPTTTACPDGVYRCLYAAIKNAGSPITFQTAGTGNIGSLCNTLTSAVSLGANSVEIPGQYSSDPTITQAGLSSYDKALDRVQPADTTAPSAPVNLRATINTSSNVSVSWQPASDNSGGYGVACYTVSRNGTVLGTTMATSFTDTTVNTTTPTRYDVTANDGAGNVGPAASFSITPPTVTLTTSRSSVTYGSPVTFTATVTSQDGGAPTGNVVFRDSGNPIGTGTLDSSDHAQFLTSSLPAGSHSITAVYQGDSTFPASAPSPAITETVSKAASTTALTSSPNPSSYTSPVTLTATVTGPGATPTGTVTFKDGSTVIGSPVAVDGSGHAQTSISTLTIGNHSLSAAYSGDGNYNASSGSRSQSVTKAQTQTALSASPSSPSNYGSPVTFTAQVTGPAGTPTGSVTFRNNGTSLKTVTLDGTGTAQFTVTLTKVNNSITASYAGSTIYLAGTSPALSQSLTNAPTSITVVSSRNPQTAPNSVTFTATVTSTAGTPTGTVTFYDGTATLATVNLASGKATFTTALLSPGGHLITAQYNGDANFAGKTSTVLFQRINHTGGVSSSTSVTSSPSTSTSGQQVTITATVTGSGGPPTGTVWFFNNGNLLGWATLDGTGHAVLTTNALPVGRDNLTVGYNGDTRFNPSISSSRRQTVNP